MPVSALVTRSVTGVVASFSVLSENGRHVTAGFGSQNTDLRSL